MLKNEVLCRGEEPPSTAIALRAGPLELLFEPKSGWVRQVRLENREVVRAIYGAIRDRNWTTVLPVVKDLAFLQKETGGFEIRFTATCRQKGIHFVWRGRITGDSSGKIRFEFHGEAHSNFLRNRIGLCLLYPIVECSGRKCVVEHTDGSSERTAFPKLISPSQPFLDIRAVRQKVTPDATLEVRFEGDIFEMEDQRNWTDASFKVYSTPLVRPFPALVNKGDTVKQTVTLELVRKSAVRRKLWPRLADNLPRRAPVEVTVNFRRLRSKPLIGLGMRGDDPSLSASAIERLGNLNLDHLRVDCRLWERDWPRRFKQACMQAECLGAGLHVAVFLWEKDESVLRQLGQLSLALRAPVRLWLVFYRSEAFTPEPWIKWTRELLAPLAPLAKFAAGTDANFAELNCQRPPRDADWLPCCSMNPQVHASDDLSLIENLAGQADVVRTVRSFCAQPLVVSTITLLPRNNPNATETRRARESLPADPRQGSLFAAGWTLGSLAELTGTQPVHSLTYYETLGPRGIMRDRGPTRVSPAYHVFAGFSEMRRLAESKFANPRTALQLAVLAGVNKKNRAITLLANLTGEVREVQLKPNPRYRTCRLKELNEANVAEASCLPKNWWRCTQACALTGGALLLKLSPYALARLELRP